jgi:membrane protein YqaA with SNARE-associated domain
MTELTLFAFVFALLGGATGYIIGFAVGSRAGYSAREREENFIETDMRRG